MNLAPEDGYQEMIMMEGDFQYGSEVNKQFHLKTTKGQYVKLMVNG